MKNADENSYVQRPDAVLDIINFFTLHRSVVKPLTLQQIHMI